jgi:hypothetical protein
MVRRFLKTVRLIPSVLGYWFATGWEAVRKHAYVFSMSVMQVTVDTTARFFGASGIALGVGSKIYRGSTIACASLRSGGSLYSKADGSIQIGENCEVYSNAIVASYGGRVEIGDHVSINPFAVLYGHGGLGIGSRSGIATGVTMVPANHLLTTMTYR